MLFVLLPDVVHVVTWCCTCCYLMLCVVTWCCWRCYLMLFVLLPDVVHVVTWCCTCCYLMLCVVTWCCWRCYLMLFVLLPDVVPWSVWTVTRTFGRWSRTPWCDRCIRSRCVCPCVAESPTAIYRCKKQQMAPLRLRPVYTKCHWLIWNVSVRFQVDFQLTCPSAQVGFLEKIVVIKMVNSAYVIETC